MKKHGFNPAFFPAPASAPLATAIAGCASISTTDVKTEPGSASQAVYVQGNNRFEVFIAPGQVGIVLTPEAARQDNSTIRAVRG